VNDPANVLREQKALTPVAGETHARHFNLLRCAFEMTRNVAGLSSNEDLPYEVRLGAINQSHILRVY
jgi:hypothetical protein